MTTRLGARIIGAAGAVAVAGFMLAGLDRPSTLPTYRVSFVIYLVAAPVILLVPRRWAARVLTAMAVLTGMFTLIAGANDMADGLILAAATVVQGGAAWALHREQPRSDASADR